MNINVNQACMPNKWYILMIIILLAFWADTYGKQRNDVNIKSVHFNYKFNRWSDIVPEHLRY